MPSLPLLASARCGMAVLTPQGEWLDANPALCRLLGETPASLVGTAAHRRLFPAEADRIDDALRALSDGQAMRLGAGIDYAHPDGQPRRLELDVDAIEHDDASRVLLQVQDATAAHRTDDHRRAADRRQEQLAYGLSHDLRASLRSIEGFATQLERQPLDEQGRDHLARIRNAVVQAGSLVEALVRLSHASTSDYADAPVDLSLLANWVAAELQDSEPAREAGVVVQPGLEARGDERHLRLMLRELLHNAWKFSSQQAAVAIEVEGRRDGANLVLCVHDQGGGFDMRHVDKLFVPFRRLHGSEDGGGHGLGLALVQVVAQRHGGRAWATSAPGQGSRFFVELPATDAGSDA